MLVGAVVVAPLLIVCAVLVTVSSLTSREIAQDLGDSYVEGAAASVQNQVGRYLADAVRVSDQYTRRIERGMLPTTKLTPWEPVMLDDLSTTPAIASICFGNVNGESTWLLHNKGRLEVGRGEGPGENQAVEYVMHADGSINREPIRRYLYDPRKRPWWDVAMKANRPTWTPVYFWFGTTALDGTASTGHTRPIRDAFGELEGVLIVDVTLGDIGGFLRRLSMSSKAFFYIVDDSDLLVATSHGNAIGADGHRITVDEHDSAPAAAVHAALKAWPNTHETRTEKVRFGTVPAKMSVVRLSPYDGIDWRLICVLPESEFLSDANAALGREVLLSGVAILAGILLALMLGRQVTQPLIRLTQHIRRVGAGDFDTRLELEAARELRVLSDALNQMASGLRERVRMQQAMEVAREVQQSLLPDADATLPGLELAGRSRYCDETGGDYFDYIPLRRPQGPATMISVGDVMGHGVAAALLMTSARAALRVHSMDESHLGRLLTRLNDLLAKDAKHGSFMTMALVAIDPQHGTLDWASAGHDLPIIYHPHGDRFASIRGSHIPLGVMERATFEEYRYEGLSPGDVILLGTDGVWETQDEEGKLFGRERVSRLLREHHTRSASYIAAMIEAALGTFRGKAPTKDDITFVVVKMAAEIADGRDAGDKR
jgi:phosphoserine phosphatase RsbU/P